MKVIKYLFVLWGLSTMLYSQTVEDDLDAMFLQQDEAKEQVRASNPSIAQWDFYGYVESENIFAISGKPAVKGKEIAKTEIRSRFHFRYGTAFFYALGVVDVFFYPLEARFVNPYNNSNFHIHAKDLYIAGGDKFQFKLGKVSYNWGVADAFRIVNFFDKTDSSEIFFKEEDERYTGVYSLQLRYLLQGYFFEVVVSPDLLLPRLPKKNGFWDFQLKNKEVFVSMPAPGRMVSLPVEVQNIQNYFLSYKNFSAGFRFGGSAKGVDFAFSYFNGYNNSMVLLPRIDLLKQKEQKVILEVLYERINKIGFDLAAAYKRFSARFETVLTPDYVAVYKGEDMSVFDLATMTKKKGRVPYWAFTLGADIVYRRNYGRIFAEYSTGFFLKDYKKYEKEFFTDFLIIGIEDRFVKERFLLRLAVMLHTTDKKPGVLPIGHMEYNFDNGLTIAFGVNFFVGQNDTLMKMFEANDLLYFRTKFNF